MKDITYKDIKSVASLFDNMDESRVRRALLYRESLAIGSLVLGKQFTSERTAVSALAEHYGEEIVCNCPAPRDRRWHKVDKGEPVSWSYDDTNSAVPGFARDYIRTVTARIEAVCAIKFLECDDRNCDIHIAWDELPNNVLGSTIVPATGDRMAACGPLCGDIMMSTTKDWTSIARFLTVLTHEFKHALGVPHSPYRSSIMWPSYLGPREMDINDIRSLLDRYPLSEAVI